MLSGEGNFRGTDSWLQGMARGTLVPSPEDPLPSASLKSPPLTLLDGSHLFSAPLKSILQAPAEVLSEM